MSSKDPKTDVMLVVEEDYRGLMKIANAVVKLNLEGEFSPDRVKRVINKTKKRSRRENKENISPIKDVKQGLKA